MGNPNGRKCATWCLQLSGKRTAARSCHQSYNGLFLQVSFEEPEPLIQVSGNLDE